jgi:arylsulfatase A-like enzyme
MNRREFLRVASVGCFSSLAGSVGPGRASVGRQRLNVLFLQMDQHHHSIMGCAGNPVVKTPNLDRLAREGVRFTNAVCATPYCSPTRAALITGKWPHTTGIVNNCKAGTPAITSDDETVEGMLFDRGYVTEHIGKWHLGDKNDLDCYKKSLSIRQRSAAQKDMLKAIGFKPAPPRDGEKFIQKAGVYATAHNHRAWQNFHNAAEG